MGNAPRPFARTVSPEAASLYEEEDPRCYSFRGRYLFDDAGDFPGARENVIALEAV